MPSAATQTNSGDPLESMAQLYRDRADAENGFDELKNQWGQGGFTPQDIERCQTSARAVALMYNWWSWYWRAAKPEARMEAITSRAWLLASVGRANSARSANDALSDADACRQDNPDGADRQYTRGPKPCKNSCGAFADGG